MHPQACICGNDRNGKSPDPPRRRGLAVDSVPGRPQKKGEINGQNPDQNESFVLWVD